MARRAKVCDLKIWIKGASLLTARGVIAENILLKYQKQAITAALNVEDVVMLLPTFLRELWI